MAKRTIEFEDSTGPFTVKVRGDTDRDFQLMIYTKELKDRYLNIHLAGAGEIENLGIMLQSMAEDLAKEIDR